MEMKKYILVLGTACLLFACGKETSDSSPAEIRFNLSYPVTRATATAFEANDAVSLYAVQWEGETQYPLQIGGNYLNNEKLTFNGTTWTPERTLYWSDQPCDFYALYPYQTPVESVEQYPFSLALDQNDGGYEVSDLLFAKAEQVSRSNGPVNLQFKHMMSKMVVNLVKGDQFEGEIPDDVVAHIYNTTTSCTVNWQTGSVEKDVFGAKQTLTMKKFSNEHFEAVVVPQNLEKRTPLIELTMGGIAYLLETSLSFRPGYVHTITVTLNTSPDQEQIEISIDPGIEGWN
jgi:hypothetical protein